MLKEVEWQPFEQYNITIYRKNSDKNYYALKQNTSGSGKIYYEVVAQNALEPILRCDVEDYILNSKLMPRKIDEEDIL